MNVAPSVEEELTSHATAVPRPVLHSIAGVVQRFGPDMYLVFVALFISVYSLFLQRWSPSWTIGDWLINYQGGFVRRGLPGELLYQLGRLLHLAPQHFLVPLTLVLYMILLFAMRTLLRHASSSLWVTALLVSPATLSFPVLDSEAGFHKEIFFLAALALFLVLLQKKLLGPLTGCLYMAVALVTATFSHEALFFYTPYFVVALLIAGWGVRQTLRVSVVPCALALGAAWLCSQHLGSADTAAGICDSLGLPLHPFSHAKGYCDEGPIAYLASTREAAREGSFDTFRKFHYLPFYAALLPLALLPLLAGSVALARAGFRREVRALWLAGALASAGSVVLFVYAIDWGRWIYIHVFSLGMLLLLLDARRLRENRYVPRQVAPRRFPASMRVRRIGMAALVATYATTWSLPHFHTSPFRAGYMGFARFALFHSHSLRHHEAPLIRQGE